MARVLRTLVASVAVLAAVGAALAAVVIVGVRTRNRTFLDAFTGFQRDVLNPKALETAGTRGRPFGVIEHTGRTSGRRYETPVGPVRDGDGWVVPVVYGRETNWVKNLLAAGGGVLRVDGRRHRIDRVELVPLARTPLATTEGTAMRLFGVTEAMRLHDGGPEE